MGYESVPEKYFNIIKIKEDVGLSDNNQKSKNQEGGHETVICNNVEDKNNTKVESVGNKIVTRNKHKGDRTKEDTSMKDDACTKQRKVSWSDIVRGKKFAGKL